MIFLKGSTFKRLKRENNVECDVVHCEGPERHAGWAEVGASGGIAFWAFLGAILVLFAGLYSRFFLGRLWTYARFRGDETDQGNAESGARRRY